MTTETEGNVTTGARCHALDSKDRGKATSQGKKWNRRRRFECKTPNELSFEGVLFEV